MIDVDLASLGGRIGEEVAVSDWLEITQQRIDQFAEATGDHQWIHVDPARAAVESPYKTTIAHGFLTLSLASTLLRGAMSLKTRMGINYGLNRVRFMAGVPAGSRIRGRFAPSKVEPIDGGVQVTWNITIEREGQTKPCAAIEWIVRYYLQETP